VASVVEAANLPLNTHGLTPSALREAMGHDKKFKHGQTRFILLRELGQAWVCEDVDSVMLDNCLESFCA
jgi:3-dehydroquinate synthase